MKEIDNWPFVFHGGSLVFDPPELVDELLSKADEASKKAGEWLTLYWHLSRIRLFAQARHDLGLSGQAEVDFLRHLRDCVAALRQSHYLSPENLQALESYNSQIILSLANALTSRIAVAFYNKDPARYSAEQKAQLDVTQREVEALMFEAEHAFGSPTLELVRARLEKNSTFAWLRGDKDQSYKDRLQLMLLDLGPDQMKLERQTWYQNMSPRDRIRAVSLILLIKQDAARAKSKEKRELLGNTLDFIFSPRWPFSLEFVELQKSKSKNHKTEALNAGKAWVISIPVDGHFVGQGLFTKVFPLRIQLDVDLYDVSYDLQKLEIAAHEVNHIVDVMGHESLGYFGTEYSADFVGFIAKRDRLPTRQECYEIARRALTEGPLSYARRSFFELDMGRPSFTARKIITFMNQFYERPFDLDDPKSPQKMLDTPPTKNLNGLGPLLPPGGNIDNHQPD